VAVFSPVGSSQVAVSITGATNPAITNVSLVANTEYAVSLPSGCKQFILKLRDSKAKLQIAYILGDSNITYWTVPQGNYWAVSDINFSSQTLYCMTPSTGQTLEIITLT
jgi:hypothetical protein